MRLPGVVMDLRGAEALPDAAIEPATSLPRGHRVCPICDVSWGVAGPTACWSCGRPGLTTGAVITLRGGAHEP